MTKRVGECQKSGKNENFWTPQCLVTLLLVHVKKNFWKKSDQSRSIRRGWLTLSQSFFKNREGVVHKFEKHSLKDVTKFWKKVLNLIWKFCYTPCNRKGHRFPTKNPVRHPPGWNFLNNFLFMRNDEGVGPTNKFINRLTRTLGLEFLW